ncbi:MAG: outer membrane protein assembly factor BamE [Verrucomicrobiales bacterium]|nr:outer membrane protein assembly factor BamE [Verrucomicrobiales bacterium]
MRQVGWLALLAACSGKLTNHNLAKVHHGMSAAEVRALLGAPTRVETSETLGIRGSSYLYVTGRHQVRITLVNDAVIGKSGNFE